MLHFNKIVYYCAFIACLIALQGCGSGEENKEVGADGDEQETDIANRGGRIDGGDSDNADYSDFDEMCENGGASQAGVKAGDKPELTKAQKEAEARRAQEAKEKQDKLAKERQAQAAAIKKTAYSKDTRGAEKLTKDAEALHLFNQKSKDKKTQEVIDSRNKEMAESWEKQFPGTLKGAGAAMSLAAFAGAVSKLDSSKLDDVAKWLQTESAKQTKAVNQKKGFFGRMKDFVKALIKPKYMFMGFLAFIALHLVLKAFVHFDLIRSIARWIDGALSNMWVVGPMYTENRGYVKSVCSGIYVNLIDGPLGHVERLLNINDPDHVATNDGCKHGMASQSEWLDTTKGRDGCKPNKELCGEDLQNPQSCMYPGVFDPANKSQHITKPCVCTPIASACGGTYSQNSPHVCLPACGERPLTWAEIIKDLDVNTLPSTLGYSVAEVNSEKALLTKAAWNEVSAAKITCEAFTPTGQRSFTDATKAYKLPSPQCKLNGSSYEFDVEALKKAFLTHCTIDPKLDYDECKTIGGYSKPWCTKTTTKQGQACAGDFDKFKLQFDPSFAYTSGADEEHSVEKSQRAHYESLCSVIKARPAQKDCEGVSQEELALNFAGKKTYCDEVLGAFNFGNKTPYVEPKAETSV